MSDSNASAAPVSACLDGFAFYRWPGAGRLPLVLLHGIGSNAASWSSLADALKGYTEIIAWDAPGYGDSRPLAVAEPSPNHYSEALADFLRCIGQERVVLVGHSLGALFAARFAAARPHQVAALGLLSPASGYNVKAGLPLPYGVQSRIDDLDLLGPDEFASARAPKLISDPDRKPELVAKIREAMSKVSQPGYRQAVQALASGDLATDAAKITSPTLVAVGADDTVTPPAGVHRIHDLLQVSVGMFEVPKSGHALPQEAPQYTADLMRKLIQVASHPMRIEGRTSGHALS
jgi:pimeloyl-ACP methyl ester carboxylesterase